MIQNIWLFIILYYIIYKLLTIFQAGVGYFQLLAALCTGLSLAADTVEFFVVPYILPSAEVELCIEDNEKGWLS